MKGALAVMLSAIFSSIGAVLIKLMTTLDASSIAWLRMTIPTIFLGLWIRSVGIQFFRGNMKKMLSASVLNAIRMLFYFLAFIYTSIGNAVILCYTWPLFVVVLGYFFLNERLDRKQLLLILLAFIGLIIAYSQKEFSLNDTDLIGMVAALCAAFMYAITVIIFKSESDNYTRNEMIFYQNLLGPFIYLPFFVIQFPKMEYSHIGMGVILGVFIGIIGFNCFFYGLRILKASVASSIMYLDVVGAIFLSWLVFGDYLEPTMIIGGALIILSSFMITRSKA